MVSRAEFHQQHLERARAEAQRLLAERPQRGGHWLAWVASELYRLSPPEYANMVRRELEQAADGQ